MGGEMCAVDAPLVPQPPSACSAFGSNMITLVTQQQQGRARPDRTPPRKELNSRLQEDQSGGLRLRTRRTKLVDSIVVTAEARLLRVTKLSDRAQSA